jgi:glucose dehydrogenase
VTAGDLVFWGDQNQRFRAFDAESGKVLWEAMVRRGRQLWPVGD